MPNLNKAQIMGHLGQDPETRYMPSGDAVTNISVATSEKWKDKVTGEQKEATEWHRVVAFGRLAEIMAEYLKKGDAVYIEGSLRTRSWEKDGIKRYSTEIKAVSMQLLGDGKGKGSGRSAGTGDSTKPNSPAPPPDPDFDDDIPF